jgi:biotin--protein ligase
MRAKKQITQVKPTIGLYSDSGVAPHSFFQLQKILSPYYTIIKLKAADIILQKWPATMKALIMPGGADVPYHQKLQGRGCDNVCNFVKAGGAYVGICAGSYFAAEEIHFTCADGSIIAGKRDLGFFKGRVVGPAFGVYIEEGHVSAQLVEVVLEGHTMRAYFNGGGFFEGGQENEILGIYKETNQLMMVQCKVGQGAALLCAVHPEYDGEFLASIKGYEVCGQVNDGAGNEIRDWFLKRLEQVVLNF